jgi:hypothetical protein
LGRRRDADEKKDKKKDAREKKDKKKDKKKDAREKKDKNQGRRGGLGSHRNWKGTTEGVEAGRNRLNGRWEGGKTWGATHGNQETRY